MLPNRADDFIPSLELLIDSAPALFIFLSENEKLVEMLPTTENVTPSEVVNISRQNSNSCSTINSNSSVGHCRYCFDEDVEINFNACHCKSIICRNCFIQEVKLTATRGQGNIKCTVCDFRYDVQNKRTCSDFIQIAKNARAKCFLCQHPNGERFTCCQTFQIIWAIFIYSSLPIFFLCINVLRDWHTNDGLVTVLDATFSWITFYVLARFDIFDQPTVYGWLFCVHLARMLFYVIYGFYNDDSIFLFLIGFFNLKIYWDFGYKSLKKRIEINVEQHTQVWIQNKGPFKQNEIFTNQQQLEFEDLEINMGDGI